MGLEKRNSSHTAERTSAGWESPARQSSHFVDVLPSAAYSGFSFDGYMLPPLDGFVVESYPSVYPDDILFPFSSRSCISEICMQLSSLLGASTENL